MTKKIQVMNVYSGEWIDVHKNWKETEESNNYNQEVTEKFDLHGNVRAWMTKNNEIYIYREVQKSE